MNIKYKLAFSILLFVGVVAVAAGYLHGTTIAVLDPKGPVALQERNLIVFGAALSLIVVIPVFALTAGFAWRYREGNAKAKYSPELDHNRVAETIWWLIPSALILVLSVVAWNSSHQLDPYKPLISASGAAPVTIQVVALDWKWLFIYPQQHIATVNFFQFPKQTPVNFEITADAPMNSFWIPQLGGQIYAMPGMSTQLHLMASVDGSFRGSSANISGTGFAGMTFVAKASSQADFNQWVRSVQRSPNSLSLKTYAKLAQPSQNNPPTYYAAATGNLYGTIINNYMLPENQTSGTDSGTQTASKTSTSNMNMSGMGMQ
jgi:cytochrome o ubiquinol oxidase subunit 2